MTSAANFGAWQERACSPARGGEVRPKWRVEARVTAVDHQILRPSRSVDEEAVMAARVPRRRSESHESDAVRGNFPELVSAHRGA